MTTLASPFTLVDAISATERIRTKANPDQKIDFMLNLAGITSCIASIYFLLTTFSL